MIKPVISLSSGVVGINTLALPLLRLFVHSFTDNLCLHPRLGEHPKVVRRFDLTPRSLMKSQSRVLPLSEIRRGGEANILYFIRLWGEVEGHHLRFVKEVTDMFWIHPSATDPLDSHAILTLQFMLINQR